jgi:NitT/TauT family transport system permease protein
MASGKPRIARSWGFVGIALLLALWEWGHHAYGSLVLPSLLETAAAFVRLTRDGVIVPALLQTAGNAGLGWIFGALIGIAAGLLAGLREEIQRALQPVAIILLGIPAIAWVVMALLWFGGRWAVIFTVAVATGPVVFAAAVEGTRSLDGALARMASVYRVPFFARLRDVYGPHMLSHLFPALVTTLAMSWKVAVMAELLTGAGGIGDGLATARAHVDTAETMAWVVLVVGILIVVDLALLQPLQRSLWLWRDDERSAGP